MTNTKTDTNTSIVTRDYQGMATRMTAINFLTKHGYPVFQSNKNRLTSKAKVLTKKRGFPLKLDHEYIFYDQYGHPHTYQPYLFREDVLEDAAKMLGLRL